MDRMMKASFLNLINHLNHSSLSKTAFSFVLSVLCFFMSSERTCFCDLYSDSAPAEWYICNLHHPNKVNRKKKKVDSYDSKSALLVNRFETYRAVMAEFLRFQNWKNKTAQVIRHTKKIGRAIDCSDLYEQKWINQLFEIKVNKDAKEAHLGCVSKFN